MYGVVLYHFAALLLLLSILQLSVHDSLGNKHRESETRSCCSDLHQHRQCSHSRVRRFPDAPQFISLHGSVAGELQQPLDVVEDGGLVVGQRKLNLAGRTQP